MKAMKQIMEETRVLSVTVHICRFGLTSTDYLGCGPMKKPTTFLSNSALLAEDLKRQCNNRDRQDKEGHRHVQLVGGRDTDEFCRAICQGLRRQLQADREGTYLLAAVNAKITGNAKSVPEEVEDQTWTEYWDCISGQPLNSEKVK